MYTGKLNQTLQAQKSTLTIFENFSLTERLKQTHSIKRSVQYLIKGLNEANLFKIFRFSYRQLINVPFLFFFFFLLMLVSYLQGQSVIDIVRNLKKRPTNSSGHKLKLTEPNRLN